MTNSNDKPQFVREDHSEQEHYAQDAGSQVDDRMQEVGKEVSAKMAELAPEEIDSISEAIKMLAEIIKSNASQYIDSIEKAIQDKGITFDELMESVASQKDWDGKSYGGDFNSGKFLGGFAGGFHGSVFSNMMSMLGIRGLGSSSMDNPKPFHIVAAIALKKAMTEDARLKKLVEAVASATEKVGREGEFEPFKIITI